MSNVSDAGELLKNIRNLHNKSWSSGHIPLASRPSIHSSIWTLGILPSLENQNLREQLADLSARTPYKNPFFELPIIDPAATYLENKVRFLYLSEKVGSHETLKLFAPIRFEKTTFLRRPVIRVWSHKYAPLGAPLVDPRKFTLTMDALADCILNPIAKMPAALLIEDFPCNHPIGAGLTNTIQLADQVQKFSLYKRPSLFPMHGSSYEEKHVSGKRRQRNRKAMERLSKHGKIVFKRNTGSTTLNAMLERTLTLEASGWKGRKNTALLSNEPVAKAARQMIANMAKSGKCEIYSLEVADRLAAATIVFSNDGYYVPWKTTYEENFAKYSVGNLLTNFMNETLSHDPSFKGLDSLATEDNLTARRFWPDSLEFASVVIGLGNNSRVLVKNISKELVLKRKTKNYIKQLINRK